MTALPPTSTVGAPDQGRASSAAAGCDRLEGSGGRKAELGRSAGGHGVVVRSPATLAAADVRALQILAQQWAAIEEEGAGRRHRLVVSWCRELRGLEAVEKRSRAQGRWARGPVDLMAVLRLDRDEVRNCRVLAWLLDPAAAHGLGTRLLADVLAIVSGRAGGPAPDIDALSDARVLVEVQRDNTRADVVAFGEGWALVIEAKINAGEQPEQGRRLEQMWPIDTNPVFCFLTRDGREMTTGSAAWAPLRWSQVALLLRQALDRSPHDARGRPAAEEYLRALEIHL